MDARRTIAAIVLAMVALVVGLALVMDDEEQPRPAVIACYYEEQPC